MLYARYSVLHTIKTPPNSTRKITGQATQYNPYEGSLGYHNVSYETKTPLDAKATHYESHGTETYATY